MSSPSTGEACAGAVRSVAAWADATMGRWAHAMPQAKALFQSARSGDVTLGQCGRGLVVSFQAFGLFVIGQQIGRGSLVGYQTGPAVPEPAHH